MESNSLNSVTGGSKKEENGSCDDIAAATAETQKVDEDAAGTATSNAVDHSSDNDTKQTVGGGGVAYGAHSSSSTIANKKRKLEAGSGGKKRKGKAIIKPGSVITGGTSSFRAAEKTEIMPTYWIGNKYGLESGRKAKEKQHGPSKRQEFLGPYSPPLEELRKNHGVKTVTVNPQLLLRLAAGLSQDDNKSLVVECQYEPDSRFYLPTVQLSGHVYHIHQNWIVMMQKCDLIRRDRITGHWLFQTESLAEMAICWYLLTVHNAPSTFPFQNDRWVIRGINASDWTDGPFWPGPTTVAMERKYIILRNEGSDKDFAVLRYVPAHDGLLEINFLQMPFTKQRTGFGRVARIPYYV